MMSSHFKAPSGVSSFRNENRQLIHRSSSMTFLDQNVRWTNLRKLALLLVFCIGLVFLWIAWSALAERSSYTMICDAGSTGTRLYLFYFDALDKFIMKRGDKITPGISQYAASPEKIAGYLEQMFDHATSLIPFGGLSATSIYLKATAGMRLVDPYLQKQLYDKIAFDAFPSFNLDLQLPRDHLSTISGVDEAWYAFLAVNFLNKRITKNLEKVESGGLFGAMDLGGKSTQVIFDANQDTANSAGSSSSVLPLSSYYANSFLKYGTDIMLHRVNEHVKKNQPIDDNIVYSPCMFPGFSMQGMTLTINGTGDASACKELINSLMEDDRTTFSDMPPAVGEFYAMSAYFYSLDAMRAFLKLYEAQADVETKARFEGFLNYWPQPTVDEIASAADVFCKLEWSELDENLRKVHPLTPEHKVSHRCFEVVYVSVLLRDTMRFETNKRKVTFALSINGVEVEWAIGAFLAEHSKKLSTVSSLTLLLVFCAFIGVVVLILQARQFPWFQRHVSNSFKRKSSNVDSPEFEFDDVIA